MDGLLSSEEVDEVQKVRRGSAPDNFFQKLYHKVTSPKEKDRERDKELSPKEPTIRGVRGTFLLDVTSQQSPKQIIAEVCFFFPTLFILFFFFWYFFINFFSLSGVPCTPPV